MCKQVGWKMDELAKEITKCKVTRKAGISTREPSEVEISAIGKKK